MENIDPDIAFILICLCVTLADAFICGFIGSKIAAGRNRSAAGFWLGFLLGPLGVIISLLLPAGLCPPSSGLSSPSSSARPPAKLCPLCGKRCGLYDRACPGCGQSL